APTTPSDAAVVVFPTPPLPTHTMSRRSRSNAASGDATDADGSRVTGASSRPTGPWCTCGSPSIIIARSRRGAPSEQRELPRAAGERTEGEHLEERARRAEQRHGVARRGRIDQHEVETVARATEARPRVLPFRDAHQREEVLEPRRGRGHDAKRVTL